MSPLTTFAIDNQNDTILNYDGNWTTKADHQIPSLDAPKPYRETNKYASSVALSFTNAVAVAINGNRNWGHWTYRVVRSKVALVNLSLMFCHVLV